MKINISNNNGKNNEKYKNSSNKNNRSIYDILKRENALDSNRSNKKRDIVKVDRYSPDYFDMLNPFNTGSRLTDGYSIIKKNVKEMAILNSKAMAKIKANNNLIYGIGYNVLGFFKTRFFNKEAYSIKDIFNMESKCIRKIDYNLDLINKRSEKQLKRHLDYNKKKIYQKNQELMNINYYSNLIKRKEKVLSLTNEELKRYPRDSPSYSTFEYGINNIKDQISKLTQLKKESMIKTKYNALAEGSSKQIQELLRFSFYTSRDLSHIAKITIEHIDNVSESWNILNEDGKIKNELLNAFNMLGNYTVRMETILGNNLRKMYNMTVNNKGIPRIYGNNNPMYDTVSDIRSAHLQDYSELERQINNYKKI